MSPQGVELYLSEEQIFKMVSLAGGGRVSNVDLKVVASDSYGPHMHRTWIFHSPEAEIVGSVERYWSGLKMICSVFGGSPRTTFFMEDGTRTTNRGLKG